jgi:Carboxypeptidase regulatory-like domain
MVERRGNMRTSWAWYSLLRDRFALPLTLALLTGLILFCGPALAGVTASISGTVKDASGAVVAGATVSATNTETGIAEIQHTNAQGNYSFQELPLGHYTIQVEQAGFKTFRQTGVVLDVNAALVVDVALEVGSVSEKLTVAASALHVETANTQMGEVIGGQEMTELPLVTRSYTDLLALQPGVVASASQLTGAYAGAFQSAGFALAPVSGSLNTGGLSVNGMREADNGFLLNGATVRETGFGGTAVIPDLDSIAEFRILTNNFDAEYGNSNGGQINVITKSGGNEFHGDAFEFVRNTDFDARNFFDTARGAYHQNQFGGTIGGPIKREKIFFFADYQGNRIVQGISSGQISVPTSAELGGNFSGLANPFTTLVNGVPTPRTVNGSAWAQELSSRLGYAVSAGEHYFTPGCTSANCVFPGALIPTTALDPVSKNILALNIFPQNTTGTFSTSAFPLRLRDDKTSGRVDVNTSLGMLSTYYYFDDYSRNDPYWPGPLPSSLPGFNVTGTGRTDVADIGDTKTLGSTAVNEVRFAYVRYAPSMNKPSGGMGHSLSALGFGSGANMAPGILPLGPIQGVPEIDFNDFFIGISSRIVKLFENTYGVSDSFSKVSGTHTLRFGGEFHYTQMTENLSNVANGAFEFGGAETGIDFADFLIGAPTPGIQGFAFLQGFAPPSYGRNHSAGFFGQDSWRVRSNLTLNYGLRWEFSAPWAEKNHEIQTIVRGLQSVVFPNSPTGWVFPGDPGIPSTLAPTRYNNFAPRIGLAYSPRAEGGFLEKLLGAPGQSSIRAAYGIFYATFEGVTDFNEIGDAPFGNFRPSFTSTPIFDEPWVDRPSGTANANPFPVPALSSSINFAASGFVPISSSPAFFPRNRLPYAEDYELSFQRQFSRETLLTVSYVGTQAHRLLADLIADPGSPAICNALTAEGAIQIGTSPPVVGCGPGNENTGFAIPAGQLVPAGAFTEACPSTVPAGSTCVPGTRLVLNPAFFCCDGYFITAGNSNYHSLQVNLRHTSSRAQVLVGYTFSKSLDDSSGYGEQINPVNARLSRGLSAFHVTNNFVVSYNLNLPFDKLGGPARLTNGWAVSGITRFSTGVPVTLIETDDHSLLGTSLTGPQPLPVDTPNFSGGSLGITDPRTSPGHVYFNTSLFSPSAIGQEGTANRRFFHGPGINNWDMALVKDTTLTERMKLEFRAEFFNLFNHAQFLTPSGILSSNFGAVLSARDPRIGQLSFKLLF